VNVGLDAVKRNVPKVRRSAASASGDRRDCLLVTLLKISERAVGIGRQQSNEVLIERYRSHDQPLQLEPDCDVILPKRAKPNGHICAADRIVSYRRERALLLARCRRRSAGAGHSRNYRGA